MRFRDIARRAKLSEKALDDLLFASRNVAGENARTWRVVAVLRLLIAAVVTAAAHFLGASPSTSVIVAIFSVGLALTLTINAWGTAIYPVALNVFTLTVTLHARDVKTQARIAERLAASHSVPESLDRPNDSTD